MASEITKNSVERISRQGKICDKSMRLIKKDKLWKVHFTVVWEVEVLAEATEEWIPFYSAMQPAITGMIHAHTHEICFDGAEPQKTNIVVTLADQRRPMTSTKEGAEDGERER